MSKRFFEHHAFTQVAVRYDTKSLTWTEVWKADVVVWVGGFIFYNFQYRSGLFTYQHFLCISI